MGEKFLGSLWGMDREPGDGKGGEMSSRSSQGGEGPYTAGTAFGLWLAFAFGVAGIHRFYLGKPITGLLYLFTFGLFGIGQVVDLIRIPALVAEANRKLLPPPEPVRQLMPADDDAPASVEAVRMALVKAASERNGSLTVTEAVLVSGRSFPEVEKILDEMAQSGYVGIGNDPETGIVIYTFGQLARS